MIGWLRRNTVPIIAVVVGAALVTGAFETLDAISATAVPVSTTVQGGTGEPEIARLAGLIKVAIFLALSVGATILVRRFGIRASTPVDNDPLT